MAMRKEVAAISEAADALERELLLYNVESQKYDNFEIKWCISRQGSGATLREIGKPVVNKGAVPKGLTCLTKVGHGTYYCGDAKGANTYAMIDFMQIENQRFIDEAHQVLRHCDSIKRINLYACKSGLPPLQCCDAKLENRLERGAKGKRYEYGKLSYAEFFIIKLWNTMGRSFPRGLKVVATLGDVRMEKGTFKVCKIGGIKPSKIKDIFCESYLEIDSRAKLVRIDCDSFIHKYFSLTREEKLVPPLGLFGGGAASSVAVEEKPRVLSETEFKDMDEEDQKFYFVKNMFTL